MARYVYHIKIWVFSIVFSYYFQNFLSKFTNQNFYFYHNRFCVLCHHSILSGQITKDIMNTLLLNNIHVLYTYNYIHPNISLRECETPPVTLYPYHLAFIMILPIALQNVSSSSFNMTCMVQGNIKISASLFYKTSTCMT